MSYRTINQLSNLIGASEANIQSVSKWMIELGAHPNSIHVSNLRDTITAEFDFISSVTKIWSSKGIPLIPSYLDHVIDFIIRRHEGNKKLDTFTHPSRQTHSSSAPNGAGSIANQKKAYGIPSGTKGHHINSSQMVWGPGTFGYASFDLGLFKNYYAQDLNLKKISCNGKSECDNNGDNFGEGSLDTEYISAMGLDITTLTSNTNKSSSTEEGEGFGAALLWFANDLSSHTNIPHILSMSLGSLSAYSCDLLCSEAAKTGTPKTECHAYLQKQRQVCMFLSQSQVQRINTAFQILGVRGVSIFAASGDGGSHFSFGKFQTGALATKLNKISCEFQLPVFPTTSPFVISVGGTAWANGGTQKQPVAWSGSGGGFSWMFPAPAHQKNVIASYLSSTSGIPPTISFNATGRAYPDISALADVCIPLCVYGGCSDSGGTSASCPTFAGIFSLINDIRLMANLKPLGFIAPRIWQVAHDYPGEAFQDITKGNTKTSCNNGFPATTGWDPTTGWGRPIWTGLLKHFSSDATIK